MALMYPSEIDSEAPDSEKKCFKSLASGLPDDWIVIHSKRFIIPALADERPDIGEADFLVFDPKRGYLCLEVKGGGISRNEKGWFTTDRHGQVHSILDPAKQAQNVCYTINNYLLNETWFSTTGITPRFGWGVVFSDIRVDTAMGPELPKDIILDQRDLENVKPALDQMFSAQGINNTPVTNKAQLEFMKALVPNLNLKPSLAGKIDAEKATLIQLTEEQIQILDVLFDARRVGVKGIAGSGKTLIALELAQRLAEDKERVLFLCYNTNLADSLKKAADGYVAKSFHVLCSDLSKAAGLKFNPPNEANPDNEFWETTAPELLVKALDALPDERWDAVIVDEGQDFREYWWLAVEKLLKHRKDSRLWVFYDPNQDIYGGGPAEALDLQPGNLTYNCRNTSKIANYSADLVKADAKMRPHAPAGEDVITMTAPDQKEMVSCVGKTLHKLVIQGDIEPKNIIILSPNAPHRSVIWKEQKFGNLQLVEFPKFADKNQIQFATLQSFKGLEADVVILCEIKAGDPNCTPRHQYVGTSRARHILATISYEASFSG